MPSLAIDAAKRLGVPSLWNIRESEPWQSYYADLPDAVARTALGCFADPYRVIFVSNGSRRMFDALETRHNFCVVHDGFQQADWEKRLEPWPRSKARAHVQADACDVCVSAPWHCVRAQGTA